MILALALLLFLALSCKKDAPAIIDPPTQPVDTTSPMLLSYVLEASVNPDALAANDTLQINDLQVGGFVPLTLQKTFVPTFTTTAGAVVKVNGVSQESGKTSVNLSKSVSYELSSANGKKNLYTVSIKAFTGIPVLYLETEGQAPIVSKDDYLKAHVKLDGNGQFIDTVFQTDLQVKGRGNTTWSMPKKPYRLKLSDKAPLLGMPSSKDWVLLANYADKSLIRNSVAFELSKRTEMPYTPRSQSVELVLNGKYAGNYLLTEQVKIAKDRIDIEEMDADDLSGDKLTGGYFMEVDFRLDGDVYFTTVTGQVPIVIKDPDDIAPAQLDYIKTYIADLETALYGSAFADPVNGYAKYIDVNTFVNSYLVNEIMKNQDANFHSSVNLYKDRGNKICIGPVWDFDIGAGNINFNDGDKPEGWWIRNYKWYKRLFDDPAFRQLVKDRWNQLKSDQINTIIDLVDAQARYLDRSQKENFGTWDILGTYVWPNAVVPGSYQGEIDYLKSWLSQRIAWMDSQINDPGYAL